MRLVIATLVSLEVKMGSLAAPWAYSKLKKFETCPKQYYHVIVSQDYKEDFSGKEAKFGNAVHKAAQQHIDYGKPIPDEYAFLRDPLEALKRKPGDKYCELKLGLSENLDPCDFFAKEVWWRGVIDLLIVDEDVAYVIDYKTGKATYADTDQLEQMSLAVFKHYEVKEVKAALIFVVTGEMIKESFSAGDQSWLWEKWLQKYAKLEAAHENDVWNPCPSGLCKRHCVVTECPHNGRND